MNNNNRRVAAAFIVALSFSIVMAAAQGTAIPKALDAGKATTVFIINCSACHDWAGAYQTIIDSGVVVPAKPDESPAWIAISEGRMPAKGTLSEEDKALILAWIKAGAPKPSSDNAAAGPAGAALPSARFFGFENKEAFHRFSGWASGGILLAAGIVGAVHAYDMWSTAHAYRDSHGIDEFNPATCDPEIALVWGSGTEQALRWTHVGLLAAGESFYIANVLTGTSFMGKLGPGWSKAKIHRYAFFVHAGLMVAEGVMGYFTSDALSRGDHDTFHTLLIAHAGVGIVIPVVILSAGAIMDPRVKL
jgi:mono/diheme cytochrome c family protein